MANFLDKLVKKVWTANEFKASMNGSQFNINSISNGAWPHVDYLRNVLKCSCIERRRNLKIS